jgi:hypothetical protein
MFNACRYPAKPLDYEATFDPMTNNHITVIRKNKFFILDLVKDGIQLSTAEIERYNTNYLSSMLYINIIISNGFLNNLVSFERFMNWLVIRKIHQ